MEWMLDIQLGRRNLSPIQRIAIAEKYRSIYEKQAKENQGTRNDLQNNIEPNLAQSKPDNRVNTKLAKVANVGKETYRMGKKILNSDNEEVKEKVLSGEMSINAGYNQIKDKQNMKDGIITTATPVVQNYTNEIINSKNKTSKPEISDETKQICADLKTEKKKDYIDSIWNYEIDVIACMNADFEEYYNGFVSTLSDMENRVNQTELDECINNAKLNVEKYNYKLQKKKHLKMK